MPSNGTIPHFTGSRLEAILGIPMTRVPYRGGAPILKDLVGGHLPFARHHAWPTPSRSIAPAPCASSRSRAQQRSPFLPDVPTLKENGIDLVADAWYGMWLPAGSAPDFARQLSAAVGGALAKPEVKEKLLAVGLIPVGTHAGRAHRRSSSPIRRSGNRSCRRPGYKITN